MSERELFKALGLREDVVDRINHYADGTPFDDIDGATPVQMREFLTKFGAESDLAEISEASVSRTKYRPKTSKSDRVRAARERKRNVAAKQKAKRAAKNPTEKRKRRKRMKLKAKKAGGYSALRQQQKKGFRFQVASMGVPALDSIYEEVGSVVTERSEYGASYGEATEDTVASKAVVLACDLADGFEAMAERLDDVVESLSRRLDESSKFDVVVKRDGNWTQDFEGSEYAQSLSRSAAMSSAKDMKKMYPNGEWGIVPSDAPESRWDINPAYVDVVESLSRRLDESSKFDVVVKRDGNWTQDFEGSEYAQSLSRSAAMSSAKDMKKMYPNGEWGIVPSDAPESRWDINPAYVDVVESLSRDVAEVARIFGLINLDEAAGDVSESSAVVGESIVDDAAYYASMWEKEIPEIRDALNGDNGPWEIGVTMLVFGKKGKAKVRFDNPEKLVDFVKTQRGAIRNLTIWTLSTPEPFDIYTN